MSEQGEQVDVECQCLSLGTCQRDHAYDLQAELEAARERETELEIACEHHKMFWQKAEQREKRVKQDRDTLSRFQAEAERREKGLREALEWIGVVAASWHGPEMESGHAKALQVIAQHSDEALAASPAVARDAAPKRVNPEWKRVNPEWRDPGKKGLGIRKPK